MTQTNYKKIATSPTLKGINKLVNNYFYSVIEIRENKRMLTGNYSLIYEIFNSKGKIENFIIMKGKNYQFLMKQ